MEKVYKDQVISHEAASNEGVREVVDRHSVVIDTELFVNVEFICLLLLDSS